MNRMVRLLRTSLEILKTVRYLSPRQLALAFAVAAFLFLLPVYALMALHDYFLYNNVVYDLLNLVTLPLLVLAAVASVVVAIKVVGKR
jgi:hypothetical protein